MISPDSNSTTFLKFELVISLMILYSFILIQCKKADHNSTPSRNYETIKPFSYYPVFPNSYWKYVQNDSIIVKDSTSTSYQLHSYLIFKGSSIGMADLYSDTFFVPFLNGNPIYGYDKIDFERYPFGDNYLKWPLLSEQVGFQFERNWSDHRYGNYEENLEVISKYKSGGDSIIVLKGHWVKGFNVSHVTYQYYKKNVGLDRYYIIDTTTSETLFKKVLVEYSIGN